MDAQTVATMALLLLVNIFMFALGWIAGSTREARRTGEAMEAHRDTLVQYKADLLKWRGAHHEVQREFDEYRRQVRLNRGPG